MSLKETWIDKVDGVDDVVAEDINSIARAVIEVEESVGEFNTVLDNLHEYAELLKGGEI